MLDSLFEKIRDIYLWPTDQYIRCDGGCVSTVRDPVATVISATIVATGTLLVILLLVALTQGVLSAAHWYRYRQHCLHCNQWTLERSSRDFPVCTRGQPCCRDCAWEHINEFDPEITCGTPMCYNRRMRKMRWGDLTYHHCTECGAVRLCKGSLESILRPAYVNGSHVGTERTSGAFVRAI